MLIDGLHKIDQDLTLVETIEIIQLSITILIQKFLKYRIQKII